MKISQRFAQRLRKERDALERELDNIRLRWRDFPGVVLRVITVQDETAAVLTTAEKLGFALAARVQGNTVKFHAVRVGG